MHEIGTWLAGVLLPRLLRRKLPTVQPTITEQATKLYGTSTAQIISDHSIYGTSQHLFHLIRIDGARFVSINWAIFRFILRLKAHHDILQRLIIVVWTWNDYFWSFCNETEEASNVPLQNGMTRVIANYWKYLPLKSANVTLRDVRVSFWANRSFLFKKRIIAVFLK